MQLEHMFVFPKRENENIINLIDPKQNLKTIFFQQVIMQKTFSTTMIGKFELLNMQHPIALLGTNEFVTKL